MKDHRREALGGRQEGGTCNLRRDGWGRRSISLRRLEVGLPVGLVSGFYDDVTLTSIRGATG
jgi:hypothetical protein